MTQSKNLTSKRKKDHIELCLTDEVVFKEKTTGFEKYDFIHEAITEVDIENLDISTDFLSKKISYPFLISCMTGGTVEAGNINAKLAEAANRLNIPVGVGSQRRLLENRSDKKSYEIIKKEAPNVPRLGNIGAAQVAQMKDVSVIEFLIDVIEADAMVIHLNPLQELIQEEGETNFQGLLKNISLFTKELKIPIIVKEVGSGISKKSAEKLLESGVKGIDVAGAGGTSWAGVETLRKKGKTEIDFWDWGLPTSFCIKEIDKLKKDHDFILIGSGGITNGFDAAKAIAFGADVTAAARPILQSVVKGGSEEVVTLIEDWFSTLKKIMFLTGSNSLDELRKNKLIKKEDLY